MDIIKNIINDIQLEEINTNELIFIPNINQVIEDINICQENNSEYSIFLKDSYKYIHQAKLFLNEFRNNQDVNNRILFYVHRYICRIRYMLMDYYSKFNKTLITHQTDNDVIDVRILLAIIITEKIGNNEENILKYIINFFNYCTKLCNLF